MSTIENITLPVKADIHHLPKQKELSLSSVLLECRKQYNSVIDVLDVLVKEITEIKKQGTANTALVTKLEERVIPEVKQSFASTVLKIEEKATDLQGHGFRLNLICRGKEELPEETHQQTEQQFREVLNTMDLEVDVGNILFRDVHRLPKPKKGHGSTQPRPIIAAFIQQKDRNDILSKAHLLKDTGISLQSHLPKKLNDLRNEMLQARRKMLSDDRSRKLRVVDKNFVPVLQEKKHGDNKWSTLKFEPTKPVGIRRSSRLNTVNTEDDGRD